MSKAPATARTRAAAGDSVATSASVRVRGLEEGGTAVWFQPKHAAGAVWVLARGSQPRGFSNRGMWREGAAFARALFSWSFVVVVADAAVGVGAPAEKAVGGWPVDSGCAVGELHGCAAADPVWSRRCPCPALGRSVTVPSRSQLWSTVCSQEGYPCPAPRCSVTVPGPCPAPEWSFVVVAAGAAAEVGAPAGAAVGGWPVDSGCAVGEPHGCAVVDPVWSQGCPCPALGCSVTVPL